VKRDFERGPRKARRPCRAFAFVRQPDGRVSSEGERPFTNVADIKQEELETPETTRSKSSRIVGRTGGMLYCGTSSRPSR